MNLTVSPQIRILALVGLLAALGLGASMFVMGGGELEDRHRRRDDRAGACTRRRSRIRLRS